jgi:6-phosphogluconate dehydrogenase
MKSNPRHSASKTRNIRVKSASISLGYIGLGKMGLSMVSRLVQKGHKVIAYARDPKSRVKARKKGVITPESIKDLVQSLESPRVIWLMVPHMAVEDVLKEVIKYTSSGDLIIDGGNSFYEDSIHRSKQLTAHGLRFMDIGVSGGPSGAKNGACLMIGGNRRDYDKLTKVFKDLSITNGYGFMGASGAGHFVKMVHNGIEYGMMQALAEGFAVMKKSDYRLDLKKIADLYNHGSVIESRLVNWLVNAYKEYGQNLSKISGTVAHTGEGEWTIKTAKKLKVSAPIIESSFKFRVRSNKNPSYTGQVLSALRNQFGGHSVNR